MSIRDRADILAVMSCRCKPCALSCSSLGGSWAVRAFPFENAGKELRILVQAGHLVFDALPGLGSLDLSKSFVNLSRVFRWTIAQLLLGYTRVRVRAHLQRPRRQLADSQRQSALQVARGVYPGSRAGSLESARRRQQGQVDQAATRSEQLLALDQLPDFAQGSLARVLERCDVCQSPCTGRWWRTTCQLCHYHWVVRPTSRKSRSTRASFRRRK